MSRYDLNQRFYKKLSASTSDTFEYVPANGEKLLLVNVGVSSSSVPSTVAHICWDIDGTPEVIISSYGEVIQTNIDHLVIGDGAKKLCITLVNDLTEPTYLGAFWQGVILI